MAYDKDLAERVRRLLDEPAGWVEKKMFGGMGYLVQGNMACGVQQDYLIVRVSPESHEAALRQPHVRVFDLTGRAMSGWIVVEKEGIAEEEALRYWVRRGVDYALTLPPK
jgi:TfoX/Sxy family transcriptional regulator of competence genes